jgi:photosystem II stability/assembly factor-like uncharacterized protein
MTHKLQPTALVMRGLLWGAAACLSWTATQALAEPKPLTPVAALTSPIAASAQMIGSAWAGSRAVAVGDRGTVLLSDDQGAHYRQAQSVPVSSQLNAVSFVDAQRGWAVGHWGAILSTTDGGEHWKLQRTDTATDRPLFAVHFFDAQHGVAAGLWSLVLTTENGGATWVEQQLPPPPNAKKADLNLLSLFPAADGRVVATAERGQLLISDDQGHTWRYIDTGYKGSLWSGAMLPDGQYLLGGQRGRLMRGKPDAQWEVLPLPGTGSITAVTVNGAHVAVAGLDGQLSLSHDGGQRFEPRQQIGAPTFTSALLTPSGQPLLFTRQGPVSPKP